MTNKLDVAAVIFDMDGLMFDTERIALRAWQKASEVIGCEIPETIVKESIGLNVLNTKKLFERKLGKEFPFYQARELRVQYAAEHIAQHGIPIKDGLFELLDMLEAHVLLKAVATSTDRSRAESLLRSADLFDRFDTLVFGDDVSNGKPEPDIFLLAAKRLGIPAEKCMVLEDSESGIQAAHNANMIPILIPDLKIPSKEVEALAHKRCTSLREVVPFLSEMIS